MEQVPQTPQNPQTPQSTQPQSPQSNNNPRLTRYTEGIPQYSFNGKNYNTREEAENARNVYTAAVKADWVSVGKDRAKYDALIESGRGLSQMSDDELGFIKDRYAKSDISKRKEYTKSDTDAYLYSMGLPSSKELNSYRQKYIDYMGEGGMEQYPELLEKRGDEYWTTDATEWIKKQWAEDNAVGLNDETVTSKGKDIKYEDTLLDEQLFELGLPPSAQLNEYFLKYKKDLEINDEIEKFNNEVFDLVHGKDQVPVEEAFYSALKNHDSLVPYLSEEISLPSRDDQKYKDDLMQFQSDKFNTDLVKALEADAKRDQMSHRISVADYKKFDYDKNTERARQRDLDIYNKSKEKYDQWFTKGATTAKEKEQRRKDVSDFLNFNGYVENTYNNGNVKALTAEDVNQIVQIEPSFRLLDNGVPSGLVQKLYTENGSYNAATLEEIRNWNDKENLHNPRKHAEVEGSLLYTGLEGSYDETVDAMTTTWRVQNSNGFDRRSKYNVDVYTSQIGEKGVTEGGALYALVAGQQVDNRAVDRTSVNVVNESDNRAHVGEIDEDSGIAYSFYSSVDSSGTRMIDYLTDDEKSVYFCLSSTNIKNGSKYLNELQGVVSKRSYMNTIGGGYGKILSGKATIEEFGDYTYNTKLYEKGEELRGLKEGRTDYWKREAWDEYSAMSDAALERRRNEIVAESSSAQADIDAIRDKGRMYYGGVEIEDAYKHELEKIDYVLNTRKQLKQESTVEANLKDYTDAKGNMATERVKASADYGESQYAELINRTEAEMRQATLDVEGMTDAVEANRQLALGGKRDANVLRSLSTEQKNKFNYLLVNSGAKVADAYIDSIYNSVDMEASKEKNQGIAGWAGKNIFTKAGATALSVLVPPATSGVFALVGTLGNALTGKETSKLQATTWDFSNEWREAVPTGDLFRLFGMSDENAQKWGQIGYGAVMSMVDSTGAAFLNLLGGELGTIALASSAFSSSLRNGLMRGLDPDVATGTAFISGLAEYATEKVGLETIMDTVQSFKAGSFGAGKVLENALLRAIKPTVTEASEEALSTIVNTIADSMLNGDLSEYNVEYNGYIDAGYTPEEARKLANKSWAEGLITDAAIGGVTGFLMSFGGMVGGVRSDTTYNRMVEAGIDPTTGRRSYDTPNNPNGKFGATKPAAKPVLSERAQAYTNGRTVVERVFNKNVADIVQNALDNNYIEDEKVSSFDGQLQRADNTDFIYQSIGANSDGSLALTDDERTALAVALAATGEDDLDVAYTMLKNEEQTPKQRLANADPTFKNIKSVEEVKSLNEQIAESKRTIQKTLTKLNTTFNNRSNELRNAYAQSMSDLQQASTLLESGDIKGATTALNALQSKYGNEVENKTGRVEDFETDFNNAVTTINQNKANIEKTQGLLNRHYATLANALNYFSLSYGSQRATAMQAKRVNEVRKQVGAKKDAILLDDSLDENAKQKAYDELERQEQDLAGLGGYLSRYANLRSGRSKFDIMQKVKNGTFQDFVAQSSKEQEQAATVVPAGKPAQEVKAEQPPQNAVTEASPANAETTSEQPANTSETGSEAVKQEDTTQEQTEEKEPPKMREVKVNKNWQKRITAVAKRFGLKVVFGELVEDGQPINGKYDPEHPDTVYLNTTLRTDSNRSNEQVIALELLRHETVHWSKETKAYESLKNMAMLYLQEQGADVQGVIDGILSDNPSYKGSQELGEEEMTAMFVQTVLFGGDDGSRRAMKWMAQSSRRNVFNSMKKYNDYLIARSEIRNARDGDAIKLLLLDAEMEFTRAIEERQTLDGKRSAQAEAPAQENTSEQDSTRNEQSYEERTQDEAEVADMLNDIPPEDYEQGYYDGGAVSNGYANNEVVPLEDELTGNENPQYNQEKNNAGEVTNGTDAGNSENGAETNGTRNQGNPVVTDGAGRRTVLPQHGLVRRGDSESNNRILTENSERIKSIGAGNYNLVQTDDKQSFVDALTKMRTENESGGSVDPKTVEELANSVTFLSDDASAGYAIEQDGNLTAVFKNRNINSKPYAGVDIILSAVANGADRLDCYGIFLANTYAKGGFVPVARVAYSREYGSPQMNAYIDSERAKGNPAFAKDPDIYFMMLSPDATMESVVDGVANRTARRYTQEELDALPLMEYDDAKFFRDGLIAQNEQKAQPAQTDTQAQTEARLSEEAQPVQEEQAHAPVTFNEQQKQKLSLVGSKLANGKRILLYINGATDFNSALEAVKEELTKYIPQRQRRYFNVATEWNGSNYENVVIVDKDTYNSIPKDSIRNNGYETSTVNLGAGTRYSRTGKSLSAYASENQLGARANQLDTFADMQRIAEHRKGTGKKTSANDAKPAYEKGQPYTKTFSDEVNKRIRSTMSKGASLKLIQSAYVIEHENSNESHQNWMRDISARSLLDWAKYAGAKHVAEIINSNPDLRRIANRYIDEVRSRLRKELGHPVKDVGFEIEDVLNVTISGDKDSLKGHSRERRDFDTGKSYGRTDYRFYAPKGYSVDRSTFDVASKEISSEMSEDERDDILSARKRIVIEAYHGDIASAVGVDDNELAQLLEKWASPNIEDENEVGSRYNASGEKRLVLFKKDLPLWKKYYISEHPTYHNRWKTIKSRNLTETDDRFLLESRFKPAKETSLEMSKRLNKGVSVENRFFGFVNSSICLRSDVTDEDIRDMIQSVDYSDNPNNESAQFQRNYIANVMLSLDTHIDWSGIPFHFKNNPSIDGELENGFYDPKDNSVTIGIVNGNDTAAHEMGHALDAMWFKDLTGSEYNESLSTIENVALLKRYALGNNRRLSNKESDFFSNFINFVDELSEHANNSSAYYIEQDEVFARFVSEFVFFVNCMNKGQVYEGEFKQRQFESFVKLLQEKSSLDSAKNAYGDYEDYWGEMDNLPDTPMYSNGHSLDYYIQQYGMKQQSPYARANNIRTPNQTAKNNRVSDAVQTLKQVPYVPQNLRDRIDEGILNEGLGVYEPKTLDELREQGMQYITEHGGVTQAMRDLTATMRDVKAKDLVKTISAANQVFATISAEGINDSREYADFVAEYVMMRSTWGRAGRAMQLVNDSPLGRRTYWERVVQRMNEQNREAVSRGLNPLFYRGGYQDIDIPQKLYDDLQNAQTKEQIDEAEEAITRYIGENSPLTVSDAMRNWRYFAMLANPVTHMRNMLGNATMQGGRLVKDAIATGLENIAVRAGWMNDDQRTHSIILRQDSASRNAIESLYQEHKGAISSGGRDGFRQTLNDAKRKSPSKFINRLMNFNSNMLENEDELFLHMTFMNAAAQFASARGIDVTKMSKQQRADLVAYATQQAQEATYRDASKLADALNEFARSGWVQQLLVEGVMPFKKTPINITKRGISYSPFGLAKGIVDLARNVVSKSKGGELVVSANKVVDELAQGLTGSMLSALGFFLARCGILKLKAGRDDRDDVYERDVGHQNYSLEVGNLSIKIESLAPLTFPLFMGASLYELTSRENGGFSVSDITDAALSVADPLMDMSFMSSLNEALDTYSENGVMGVAGNVMWSYASQYLPTLGSKVNNFINESFTERRTAKSDAASPLGGTWDYRLRSAASKVPVANQAWLEPYVSTSGTYQRNDSFGEYVTSFLNNFVSPVNVQVVDTTPVNDEIHRLVRETGNTDFVPQNPTKYFNIGNERKNLNASEYTQYSKDHNETVYAVLTQLINEPAYQNLTDEQRVDVLTKAYNSAHRSIQQKYQGIYSQKQK